MNVVLNNLVFSAKTPQVGDKCLLIQTGNNKYCVPLTNEGITNEGITNEGLTNLYKCVNVDATNKKWSGNKAVLTDGVYTFEENVTSGLTFGAGFTPQVWTIYNADATVRANLWAGFSLPDPVFKLICDSQKDTAETGQSITWEGTVTFNSDSTLGKTVMNTAAGFARITDTSWFPVGSAPFSVRTVQKTPGTPSSPFGMWDGYSVGHGIAYIFYMPDGNMLFTTQGADSYELYAYNVVTANTWHTTWVTYDGATVKLYVDGVNVSSGTDTLNTRQADFFIGKGYESGANHTGNIESVQVWNQCISAEDIQRDFEFG